MELLKFDKSKCDLCGKCIERCPFGALRMDKDGIVVSDKCRMCSICVKNCHTKALWFEQVARSCDKSKWRDILVYVEQEQGDIHPVAYELIGEAHKLAAKVGYDVNCVIVGGEGTAENARKLLPYGVKEVFVYEHPGFDGFKADCYSDAVADCISATFPSCVLVGATACGRSLAPRLAVRFHTGLTADCTELQMKDNTDLVQIRPAFGGNIMAQIIITQSRPQFATVRYKVMDKARKVENPTGKVTMCNASDHMVQSGVRVLERAAITRTKSIEEEDVLVVAGRGVKSQKDVEMVRELASLLGGQLCFTRPMVEEGYGDSAHQIGLSGRTVKPKLIITCGVSGAVQFTASMNTAQTIVAINSDPNAQIFNIAHYKIVDDLYQVVPELIARIKAAKEVE
ncbi:MAG: FAD-binding protein [Clostridia bacterium]|nr:FAD-binding protein [Clostridia bacterium]